MRVLIAGATGVLGRQAVPVLEGAGHQVTGLSANLLDPGAVATAVTAAQPDAVIHLATKIPADLNPRHLTKQFEVTNRLRTEGMRNLMAAAGGAKFITQGLAYAYRPAPGLADEDAPLWTDGPVQFRAPVLALAELERLTAQVNGTVLRFGHLYGPGTAFSKDGSLTAAIRAGKLPLAGGGNAVYSFTHTRDAAMAILAALDRNVTGALNVVDDEPAPLHVWLPFFAKVLGAPAPKRLPAWIARLAVGGFGLAYLNELRGADNARARLVLDWRPGYTTWRDGLPAELS